MPPLQTSRGHDQARAAGIKIRNLIEERCGCRDYKMFFYLSPYKRSLQTYEGMRCGGGVDGERALRSQATSKSLPAPKGQGAVPVTAHLTRVCLLPNGRACCPLGISNESWFGKGDLTCHRCNTSLGTRLALSKRQRVQLAFLVIAIALLTCLACQTRPCACPAAALPCGAARSVCFAPDNIMGVQEEVQLREQDFGNFQVGGLSGAGEGCRRRCEGLWQP